MTRARASSAPAGADEAPARAPRRAVPLRAGQMRQRRAPASRPRDCCARLAQAGVRNPCDQTHPFGHRQQRAERQGSPDCGKRRRLQATTSEAIGGAPAATCDRLAQRHHRIRRGTFRPGVPTQIRDFAPPLCRPRFRRAAGSRRRAGTGPAWPSLFDTSTENTGGGAAASCLQGFGRRLAPSVSSSGVECSWSPCVLPCEGGKLYASARSGQVREAERKQVPATRRRSSLQRRMPK